MNFDFNQLNEMIVPELQDLAKKNEYYAKPKYRKTRYNL